MIKLSKTDVNSLILKYLEEEGYQHAAFSFKSEGVNMNRNIIIDIDLVTLVSMGLQFKYGVDHYINNKIISCDVDYSIIKQHKCNVVEEKFYNDKSQNVISVIDTNKPQKTDIENKNNYFSSFKGAEYIFDYQNKNIGENNDFKKDIVNSCNLNSIVKKSFLSDEEFSEKIEKKGLKKYKEDSKNDYNPVKIINVKEDEISKDIIYGGVENKRFGDFLLNNSTDLVKDNINKTYDGTRNESSSHSNEVVMDDSVGEVYLENIDRFPEFGGVQKLCFEERILSECKEAEIISWNGDYLAVKTVSGDLFGFRFGNFLWKRPVEDVSALLWFNDRLITGHFSGKLNMFNTANYRKKVYEKHADAVVKIFFDGKRVYSCSLDGTIATDDNLIFRIFDNGIKDAFLIDSTYIVCSSVSGNLSLLDLTCKGIYNFNMGKRMVQNISYNGKSKLSVSTQDGCIGLFGVLDKSELFFNAHEGSISAHTWVGNRIISSGNDKKVKLWDIEKRECIFHLKSKNPVKHIKTISNLIVMSSTDNFLYFFDERIGYINKYPLKNRARNFEISPSGCEICVLIENSFPTILNLLKL